MPDDTPTPAPALTDEQIDNMAATFRDTYALTLPPFAHPTGKDLFDRWLAAVIARAKREERERIRSGYIKWRCSDTTCLCCAAFSGLTTGVKG